MNMSEEIRIYVADLAAYNNGVLHGVWIDATDDLDTIQDQINAMLKATPIDEVAEEYAIHDYEGFGGYRVSEYEGIEQIHEIACLIGEYPDVGGELLDYYSDVDEARKAMEENYCGCHKSVADYAQDLTEQTGDIPKHLECYIDYSRMGYDMEVGGDIFTIETGHEEVHIFWSR